MDAWTAVDVSVLLEDLLNQGSNVGIFSLVGTGRALFPGVIAAYRNVQGLAEQLNGIILTLLCDELKFYTRLRKKMPIAFLIHRAPAARVHFLALSGGFLPPLEEDAHFQEKHLSRVRLRGDTNGSACCPVSPGRVPLGTAIFRCFATDARLPA
jgi:hypothetical protein